MFESLPVDSSVLSIHSDLPLAEREAIDQALQLVYTENVRRSGLLGLTAATTPTLADLRQSPLGLDLQRLAEYAVGTTHETPDEVLTAIESTLQVLFWPTAADDYVVPAPFWRTLIGRTLARAKRRALTVDGLLGVSAAARLLGVDEATIERWTAERLLDSVPTNPGDRPLIGRRSVERLLAVAAECADADVQLAVR